jgi:hypothetical protein
MAHSREMRLLQAAPAIISIVVLILALSHLG